MWAAADNLRANSKLTSSDYFMPVLGIIFLRHAANRFDTAARQIAADQASGKMPKRKVLPADYIRRRALFLPESARFDTIMAKASTDPAGFFYTRTVPCELWHFDRAKPAERQDQVLMLDARTIGQLMPGSRKVHEFTPEQMRNLTAIVWLYRGQRDRFLALVQDYFKRHAAECAAVPEKIAAFFNAFAALESPVAALAQAVNTTPDLDAEITQTLADTLAELSDARKACDADAKALLGELAAFVKTTGKKPPATNDAQHVARKTFDPVAVSESYDRRATGKLVKQLEETRRAAVEQLKHATYFHRHVAWLQDRFPQAEMQSVLGLVKVVTRADIEAADWSLTPGRYVGVAPAEVDEDFDFELTITEIHTELAGLNAEAVELAATIQKNLEELGV